MAICRGCGQEIIFIKASSGRSIPCDPKPVPYVRKVYGRDSLVTVFGEVIRGTIVEDRAEADGLGYITHFATCPVAHKFRRS